jgi:hypothetical protein
LDKGHVTLTPLRFDFTHYEILDQVAGLIENQTRIS